MSQWRALLARAGWPGVSADERYLSCTILFPILIDDSVLYTHLMSKGV